MFFRVEADVMHHVPTIRRWKSGQRIENGGEDVVIC